MIDITLCALFPQRREVCCTTKDNAKAGQDYVETKGALTFAPSQTTAAVNVELLPYYPAEGTESFSIGLKQGGFPPGLNVTSCITAKGPDPRRRHQGNTQKGRNRRRGRGQLRYRPFTFGNQPGRGSGC
ncbi:Calx-beta domain-containing protein [Leisingera sp.]|uniref:Calx-beta domain-containing protein n=1 Tax=Leisingera sp. TaxID=1879318 RepID=UPI003A5C738A